MKVCVIGGSGHIGKNLVEMLLGDRCQVTLIATGRTPLPTTGKWDTVTVVEQVYGRGDPAWGECLRQIAADAVIDILGADVPATYEAARDTGGQMVACGSVWMFGEPRVVPTPDETQNPCEFEGYAVRYEELQATRERAVHDGFPFAAVMPPNICGPGKIPLDALGGRDIEVHRAHQRGEPVILPEPGQTLVGPCDAWDVARGFYLAVQHRDAAAGEIFNVGSAYALTARQFVETYGRIYGVEIPIEWVSWKEYAERVSPDPGANYHFRAHMCPDLTKIGRKLGYVPRFTPEETMERAVDWMRREAML